MFGRLRSGLQQTWLRIRFAEHVGTRLTPEGARAHFPMIVLSFGATALFGAFFGASVVDRSLPIALFMGSLFLFFLLGAIVQLRMLIGYWRPDRYPVLLDLWSDSGPEPWRETESPSPGRSVLWSEPSPETANRSLFRRLENAFWLAFLWFGAVVMWVIALALLFGLIVGEFPHGASRAE